MINYLVNFILMIINTCIMCYIKFANTNKTVINADKDAFNVTIIAIIFTIVILIVNIYEAIALKRQDKLNIIYIVISILMLILPYVIYTVF